MSESSGSYLGVLSLLIHRLLSHNDSSLLAVTLKRGTCMTNRVTGWEC